ncbi:MAG: alpha/beta hydrolase, partial [Thermoanaerobaculia bacterium]
GDDQASLPGAYAFLPWPLPYLAVVLTWGAFAGGVFQVREILVQYVGDVAAYVSPSVLDRFADLRRQIKDTVGAVARAVYESAAADGRGWQYDRVILVGHSLGSLIAYDTLNRLINEDALEGEEQQIVSRTGLFLTLGSPLDKTAFLFARQGKSTSEAREALAGSVQPMIQSYARRPRRWVNVYSPHDVVSGELDFYDDARDESARQKWIENRRDPEATVPLLAHVQYWKHREVLDLLHASITQ